jgi:hypothetical protein
LQARKDAEMDVELKGFTKGFAYKVKSFTVDDVNDYRFHTRNYEWSRPNQKTTNTGVCTPDTDEHDYYDIVEEIYELNFGCRKAPNPVVFKCHWFDSNVMRTTPELGQVKIRQDSVYQGKDVYIMAQQAHKFIISHGRAKKTPILSVGTLCGWYHRTVNCLSQTMRITTLTQTHGSSINQRG